MIAAIDQDHESASDAALAALAAAEEILEDRAKYIVVGQLLESKEHGRLDPSSREAIKVALGFYSTEGDAASAAESLWASGATGDKFRCWVLPMFYGTPADLHGKRKEAYAKAEENLKDKLQERVRASIRKRQEEMEERARGGKGSCEVCGHQPYDHSSAGQGKGKCLLSTCECPKWKERKK